MCVAKRCYPEGISTQDLHWLAGLLEGEGSFLKGPPSAPRHPVIALQMTDDDVVARVAAMSPARWAAGRLPTPGGDGPT